MPREQTPVTLVSADARLIGLTQASAAAVGASVSVVTSDLQTIWRVAPAILIGADQVADVVTAALPRRERVFLLGQNDDYQTLCRWSMPLSATVIGLPEGAKWLSRVLARQESMVESGLAVAIRSGAGGVGASTLAAGLSIAAARQSRKVALVDSDPYGGGLDLLFGAENTPGWRWDQLRSAVGQIADITAMLPHPHQVTLVSMDRDNPQAIPVQALEAVVDCLARTHDLVVIDPGRFTEVGKLVAHRTIVITGGSVRSIASTRGCLQGLDLGSSAVVVRRGGLIPATEIAQALELPLIGVIPQVADLAQLADRGIAPTGPRRWDRACRQILRWCFDNNWRAP